MMITNIIQTEQSFHRQTVTMSSLPNLIENDHGIIVDFSFNARVCCQSDAPSPCNLLYISVPSCPLKYWSDRRRVITVVPLHEVLFVPQTWSEERILSTVAWNLFSLGLLLGKCTNICELILLAKTEGHYWATFCPFLVDKYSKSIIWSDEREHSIAFYKVIVVSVSTSCFLAEVLSKQYSKILKTKNNWDKLNCVQQLTLLILTSLRLRRCGFTVKM